MDLAVELYVFLGFPLKAVPGSFLALSPSAEARTRGPAKFGADFGSPFFEEVRVKLEFRPTIV